MYKAAFIYKQLLKVITYKCEQSVLYLFQDATHRAEYSMKQ